MNKVEEFCPIWLYERKNTSVTRKKAKSISRRYSLTKPLVFSKTDAVCTYTGRVGSAFYGVKNNDGRNNPSMFPNDPRLQMIPKIDRK